MMGWSYGCYIPSFVEIDLSVPEKKIFDRFLPYSGVWRPTWSCFAIYGHGGHLGHATSIMSSAFFIFLYLKAFMQSLVQIGTVVSEKIQFEFLYVHNLGPRSRYDLDLQFSHIVINSIRCLLLLTFRSLAAIIYEKSTVITLSYRKA